MQTRGEGELGCGQPWKLCLAQNCGFSCGLQEEFSAKACFSWENGCTHPLRQSQNCLQCQGAFIERKEARITRFLKTETVFQRRDTTEEKSVCHLRDNL